MISCRDKLLECRHYYNTNLREEYGDPAGCLDDEIQGFERKCNFVLPDTYRQFLRWMGKDVDGVFKGSEWFLKDIAENTAMLSELLKENDVLFEHSGNPICFFSHQGYMSAWFYLPSYATNPTCFFYTESNADNLVQPVGTFSEFLLSELKSIQI